MNTDKAKDWIRENVPMLSVVFENKYTGMLYDRFASLPATKQKQVLVGIATVVMSVVVLHLSYSYWSLWSLGRQGRQSIEMISLLKQFQSQQGSGGSDASALERNASLAIQGNLKAHLMAQARGAGISPRMIQADESGGPVGGNDASGEEDMQMKSATVKLQRVNLKQLKSYLQSVEFGNYSLGVSSIQIRNDDKIRGYMDVDMGIVAYLVTGAPEE